MRRLIPSAVAVSLLAAAAASAAAQEGVTAPAPTTAPAPPLAPVAPPVVVPHPPRHPAVTSGWGRARRADEPVRAAPADDAAEVGRVPTTALAARAQRVARDAEGGVWVRLAYPGDVHGWLPGASVAPAPPPPRLTSRTRRTLIRATASLGRGSALVVRDPLGRTVFVAGTRRPLSIASLTKLATVTAALDRFRLTVSTTAAILGPSDNVKAQALSTSVGGGSRARGARRAVESAAARGATFSLVDGSGLSPANRASAIEMTDLLLGVRESDGFRVLFRGMPVAGRTGTLAGRMRGTAASGRVRAKTGSLFDHPTSALAGYLWPAGSGTRPDRALVFAMIENGSSPYRARPTQDLVATTLTARGALRRD